MKNSSGLESFGGTPRDLKLAFIAARERGESLGIWLERHPQYARTLIDLAIALDVESTQGQPNPDDIKAALVRARAELNPAMPLAAEPTVKGLVKRSRALGIKVRQLATAVRLTSDVLYKLDRGVLETPTVPTRLVRQLAVELQCSADRLLAELPSAPTTATAMYYADTAPMAARQQSFAEALAQSEDLSDDDRAFWLEIVREEGLPM